MKKKDNEKNVEINHSEQHEKLNKKDIASKDIPERSVDDDAEQSDDSIQINEDRKDSGDVKDSDEEKDSQMEDEIEKLHLEAAKMKDMALRTQADFVNYKKRVAKEKIDMVAFANEQLILEQLEIIDNFERALESETDKASGFYKGVELILKQLVDTLSKFGLKEIEALDKPFDHNFHHAVMQEEGENPDHVCAVLQKGYMLKDKVIRASMVKVSK